MTDSFIPCDGYCKDQVARVPGLACVSTPDSSGTDVEHNVSLPSPQSKTRELIPGLVLLRFLRLP